MPSECQVVGSSIQLGWQVHKFSIFHLIIVIKVNKQTLGIIIWLITMGLVAFCGASWRYLSVYYYQMEEPFC